MIETPDTEEAVSEAVRAAAGEGAPLALRGGGTRLALGRPVQAARTLSLAALDGVTLYEPGELTLVAQAGMPLSALEALLDAENQQLTFEPMDHRALLGTTGEPTLGGAIATGAAGPRRLRMGAARDAVLGVRYVNGQGDILRAGGRVMKNVTGYDVPKLMCGAYGTLGVVTEVGLKVMPKAEVVRTVALSGLSDERAIAALSKALATPCDVSGAAHLPGWAAHELGHGEAMTLLRIEGFESQAAYRAQVLTEALAGFGAVGTLDADPWPAIRDAMVFAGDDRAVWRIALKATDAPSFVASLREAMDVEAFYDWGGGLVWLGCAAGGDAGAEAIRQALSRVGGHATLVRAGDAVRAAVPVFQPESAPLAALSAGLKARFDPAGVLNPGRMRA